MHRVAWSLVVALAACRSQPSLVTPTPARDAPIASAAQPVASEAPPAPEAARREIAPPAPRPADVANALKSATAFGRAVRHLGSLAVDPADRIWSGAPIGSSECQLGQTISLCQIYSPPPARWLAHCVETSDGRHAWDRVLRHCDTPLVIDLDERPVRFTRPGPEAARFAIGVRHNSEWVSADTPWLVLDRDGNGHIDDARELFGADGRLANGFDELAELDDNHDGRIDPADAAFARLALWYDRDQDRRSAASEIEPLAAAGIVAIDLAYATPAVRATGSYEGERAGLSFRDARGVLRGGRVIDVHLEEMP